MTGTSDKPGPTPGPWRVHQLIGKLASGEPIPDTQANLSLAEAAPELLEFVKKVARIAAASDYGRVEDVSLLADPSRNVWLDAELLADARALLVKVRS